MPSGRPATKSRVALIGTGGTIAALRRDPFDLADYDANGRMLDAPDLLTQCPPSRVDPDSYPLPFISVSSTRIGFEEWQRLCRLCDDLVKRDPELSGIVISHGTATLEETAY